MMPSMVRPFLLLATLLVGATISEENQSSLGIATDFGPNFPTSPVEVVEKEPNEGILSDIDMSIYTGVAAPTKEEAAAIYAQYFNETKDEKLWANFMSVEADLFKIHTNVSVEALAEEKGKSYTQGKICGNYCGTGWCGGRASSNPKDCDYEIPHLSCMDYCCRLHSACCIEDDKTPCDEEFLLCSTHCEKDVCRARMELLFAKPNLCCGKPCPATRYPTPKPTPKSTPYPIPSPPSAAPTRFPTSFPTPAPTGIIPNPLNILNSKQQKLRVGFHSGILTTHQTYELSFKIFIHGTVGSWGSIIHFTENVNCCTPASRNPALWLWPSTTKLHMIGATRGSLVACNPTYVLPQRKWQTITMRVAPGARMEIFINGISRCYVSMGGATNALYPGARRVTVWTGDPWHPAAAADIRDVSYKRLLPHYTSLNSYVMTNGQKNEFLAYITSAQTYEMSMWMYITPDKTPNAWTEAVRFTAGGECCAPGTRQPTIFIYPNSRRLHIRTAVGGNGNHGCDPGAWVAPRKWTKVTVRVANGARMEVFFNGMSVCHINLPGGTRALYPSGRRLQVWASGPWYGPLPGYTRGIGYKPLVWSNSDLLSGVKLTGSKGMHLGVVKSHQFFELNFRIYVWRVQPQWANIVHFTTSGACCTPGFRSPAIWLFPNSLRMHIRHGTSVNGNEGCDPGRHLALKRWTHVVVRFAPGNRMEVFMDGLSVCYRQLPGIAPSNLNLNVWGSNPWDVSAAAW
eukprot:CAMPEP_0114522316 /NCGR_PEP_ID=MMETSP0109-20121206/20676_1 /TAXON_ID=29199 /ORGANISM="Chlorarachnion reptans, Strain CCCM449" /LENGTH=740 /DNA_ID=CAMNT_0001703523 /DNA_START=27 /DNA_END=2246 /DNA_ORIENTATION=+